MVYYKVANLARNIEDTYTGSNHRLESVKPQYRMASELSDP